MASWLNVLGHNLGGTENDATISFVYTDASQLASRHSSNDALAAWTVKYEEICLRACGSVSDAKKRLAKYIEFYNRPFPIKDRTGLK